MVLVSPYAQLMRYILFSFFPLQDDNVIFIKEYEEAMSHLIFAGSDVILCQSFDDPVLQVPVWVAYKHSTENR